MNLADELGLCSVPPAMRFRPALTRGEALPEAVSAAIEASQRATAATTTAAQAAIQ